MEPHPLAQHALDPISNDRVSNLLGHRESQPARQQGLIAFAGERQDVAPMKLHALRLHAHEVGSSTQPHLLRDLQSPTSSRSSPRSAYGPSRGDAATLHDHHGSSCGRGSRACAFGSCYAAGTYASRQSLRLNGTRSIQNGWKGVKLVIGETDFGFSNARVTLPLRGPRGSSIAVDLGLPSETGICYQRQRFSCGQVGQT